MLGGRVVRVVRKRDMLDILVASESVRCHIRVTFKGAAAMVRRGDRVDWSTTYQCVSWKGDGVESELELRGAPFGYFEAAGGRSRRAQ